MKKIKLIIFILALIISFGAGIFAGKIIFDKSKDLQAMYNSGWNAAKERVDKYKISEEQDSNKDVKIIIGKVAKIENSKIYLDITPFDSLDDPSLDQRILIIDDKTVLQKNTKKDDESYKKELEDFYQKNPEMRDRPDAVGMPSAFAYVQINIKDIASGLKVRATSEKNIRFEKEFTVKELLVLSNN
jgi:hypothetical protein